jgi:nitrate reductase NapE
MDILDSGTAQRERKREVAVFLTLVLVIAPLLAVAIVAGFGLAVWLTQLFVGPPTG